MATRNAFERVSDYLQGQHFADPLHGKIFDACRTLINNGHIATPVTLKTYLTKEPDFVEAGGGEYLVDLLASVVSVYNADEYGRIIYDLFLRRCLMDMGDEMMHAASHVDIDTPATDHITVYEKKLFDLAMTGQVEGGFTQFDNAVEAAVNNVAMAVKRGGKLAGMATHLTDLDNKMGGLHKSDLLILAGRPSMGKTSLATNIAFNITKAFETELDQHNALKVKDGGRVAFFSLEMSADQLATRILAEQAEVSSHKLRTGDMSDEEFQKIINAKEEIAACPLFIDDTPAISVATIRSRCRRLARQPGGLGLVVIDYLQLLQASPGDRSDSRVQELSAITRDLKALAKELHVPVIALSQLSRAVESRDDKRPQLSDLRESGSIEQDADVVMFVYREQYYVERAEPTRRLDEDEIEYNKRYATWAERVQEVANKAEVILAKQRHGPIGSVKLYFDGNYTKFGNLLENAAIKAY
jgi:replicative DNA helicase